MTGARSALVGCVALLTLVSAVASGQPAQSSAGRPAVLPTDAELRVKQSIEASFRVLPIQDGIILVPRSRRIGVDNVELREGTIAINGTVVTGAEVRQRLGRDGDSILELSYMDPDRQRALMLGSRQAGPGQPPETTPSVAAPSPSERVAEPPGASEEPAAEEPRTIRRVSNGRVRIGGNITVDDDEEVNGAVVAVGGSVTVNGRVRDAVVAVGGGVRLGPKAEISGDVTTVGGSVSRDAAAVVHGQVNEVDLRFPSIRLRPIGPWRWHVEPWWGDGPWRSVRLLGTLVRMGLFGLLAALLLLLVPRSVERIDRTVRAEPWKAALVGFFAELIFVPLLVVTVVVLAISIIGIPLLVLVPFAILGFFIALLLGFAGAASSVAHAARDRFGWRSPTPFALLVVGLLLIWGLTMTGRVIALGGGPLALAGGLLVLLGFFVEYAAWTVGLGGTILTRFGRVGGLYPPPAPPYDERVAGEAPEAPGPQTPTEPPPLS